MKRYAAKIVGKKHIVEEYDSAGRFVINRGVFDNEVEAIDKINRLRAKRLS